MRKWIYVFVAVSMTACGSKDSGDRFEVSGTIANSTARMIYLEELPAGARYGTIVDSALLEKEGRYKLETDMKESLIYSLRLDQNPYAAAYFINDVPALTVDVELNKQDNQFANRYEIKGSPASEAMKNFVATYNNDLEKIYAISRRADSLTRAKAHDSLLRPLNMDWRLLAGKVRNYTINSLRQANNPALIIFELGYYQTTDRRYGLQPLSLDEESAIVNELVAKFPQHQGVKVVKNNLDEQVAEMKKAAGSRWVGKPAPDFSLPDINGKEIKLSSFKGKYVLVDFWASWCSPCRQENPNVVNAYNQFRDKNFTVLGVSLDRPGQKDKWLEAIKNDNLAWTHVSDLQYWNSIVVPLYEIGGIPYNVLVDPQGMIVAENLRGAALREKLVEVLK